MDGRHPWLGGQRRIHDGCLGWVRRDLIRLPGVSILTKAVLEHTTPPALLHGDSPKQS